MKYTREQLINLRKKLINFLPVTHKEKIDKLTDILIEYPTISYCETTIKDIDRKWFKKTFYKTGHDCWGNGEYDIDFYICGWNEIQVKEVFFDVDNTPITASKLNINTLLEEVKEEHNKSFKL